MSTSGRNGTNTWDFRSVADLTFRTAQRETPSTFRINVTPSKRADYLYRQHHDRKILARVNEVIRDTLRNPFTGIGNPEPLKSNFQGWWSRRITQEHRLVYRVENDVPIVMQCRLHYDG